MIPGDEGLARWALKRAMDEEDMVGIPLPSRVQQGSFIYRCLGEWKEYWIVQPDGTAAGPLLVPKAQWKPV